MIATTSYYVRRGARLQFRQSSRLLMHAASLLVSATPESRFGTSTRDSVGLPSLPMRKWAPIALAYLLVTRRVYSSTQLDTKIGDLIVTVKMPLVPPSTSKPS